jgi:hypothetical protein
MKIYLDAHGGLLFSFLAAFLLLINMSLLLFLEKIPVVCLVHVFYISIANLNQDEGTTRQVYYMSFEVGLVKMV